MTKTELNKHFVEWFYNSNWVENYNRNGWMRDHFNNADADARHYWMLEAFMAGYDLYQREYLQEMDAMFDELDVMIEQSEFSETWPFPEPTTTTKVTQFAAKSAWPFPGE